jgi:hypothetical protein
VDVAKPRWSSSSFLLYAGAFTVLAAAIAAYAYLANQYGDAAFVGWTALMLAILGLLALVLRRRGTWLTAGLFAYLAVSAFGTFVGALFTWWGWGGGGKDEHVFRGWHWVAWLLVVLVLIAATSALVTYKFPLLVLTIAVLFWYLVTDIVSGGGSWTAVVTLFVGFAYFLAGLVSNRVYGFWLHVAAGLLVGGALLYWWHSSTADWWLLFVAGLVFISIGRAARRSSWTVLGALGMVAAATHFSIDWTTGSFTFFEGPTRVWTPIVVFAVLGFIFVVLGLGAARREPAPE